MRKNILIIFITLLIVIVVSISVLFYSILFKNIYNMDERIFDISIITDVAINDDGETFVTNNKDYIEELLSVIKGSNRTTRKQSVSDSPNGEKIVCIDINYINNSYKRIYAYNYENDYYLELPYEGVYKLSENEYNLIKNFKNNYI